MCILPCPPLWLSSPPNVLLAPPPALLWQTSRHTPSPLSSTHAVRSSCCPLLLLSTPPRKQNKKHAKHCSSPVHLIPFFYFFLPSPCPRRTEFAHLFIIIFNQTKTTFRKKRNKCPPTVLVGQILSILFSVSLWAVQRRHYNAIIQCYDTCLGKPYLL